MRNKKKIARKFEAYVTFQFHERPTMKLFPPTDHKYSFFNRDRLYSQKCIVEEIHPFIFGCIKAYLCKLHNDTQTQALVPPFIELSREFLVGQEMRKYQAPFEEWISNNAYKNESEALHLSCIISLSMRNFTDKLATNTIKKNRIEATETAIAMFRKNTAEKLEKLPPANQGKDVDSDLDNEDDPDCFVSITEANASQSARQ